MLRVQVDHPMEVIEAALRRAAHENGANVVTVMPVGQHLRESKPSEDAIVFGVCQPELYAALLAAEIRSAAFLPCRIAACSQGGRVTLEAVSPLEMCRLLNRPDLAPLLSPLEALLLRIMNEAAQPLAAATHAAATARRGGLGATEEQVYLRGSLPQRIDCRGTKLEDMGGTGEHDSKGG